MTKQRWLGVALGVMVFLIAFGLALAQQLFQVSRTVPADLEVFDTTVLPDGQLQLEFRDGVQVEFLGFRRFQIQPPLRQFNEDAAGTRRIFARNATEPPIRLRLFDPCRPAVDSNTGQEIGFFVADLHGGNIWWDEQAGRWNDDDREWAGNTCDPGNERPEGKAFVMPGQTFTMDIRLELNEAYRNIDPTTIALEPVVIGGVGREVLGPAPIQPPAGMVGWWPGDGNAEDIIGGNHGTLTGDFVEGMVQQGFGLDGVSDHILVSDSADLNITGDVTVDLWARRTAFGAEFGYEMISKSGVGEQGNSGDAFDMWFRRSNVVAAGSLNTTGSYDIIVGPVVEDTDFHHYAYVRSGNRHMLFMDGEVVASVDLTADAADTSGIPMTIGAFRFLDESGFCCHFGGVIDEVEVFNRALTAEEIRAIYNAGSAGKIKPEPSPYGEFHGSKWNDINGDGAWDAGEPGLPGWEIVLDLNRDGTADRTTITGASGEYWFMEVPPGTFDIWETPQAGWVQTYPNKPKHTGGSSAGQVINTVDFGNMQRPKIVFVSDRDGDNEIFVMNDDGSEQTQLTHNAVGDQFPAWSPDGTKIVFAGGSGAGTEIYVMEANGDNLTQITDNSYQDGWPAFSPDGTKIAFANYKHGNTEVFVMDANGANETRLTGVPSFQGWNYAPSWSADGARIAFRSDRGGNSEIWAMDPDGSNQTNITASSPEWDEGPEWSPDGGGIAFHSQASQGQDWDVWVMNADGSAQVNLTNNPAGSDTQPTWSPDSGRIAFASVIAGDYEIFTMGVRGGDLIQLTDNDDHDVQPRWSRGVVPP